MVYDPLGAKRYFPAGIKVVKLSGKPFKSGSLENTVTGITVNRQHPDMPLAATFTEDDSVVCLTSLKKAGDYHPQDMGVNQGMNRCHYCGWHLDTSP